MDLVLGQSPAVAAAASAADAAASAAAAAASAASVSRTGDTVILEGGQLEVALPIRSFFSTGLVTLADRGFLFVSINGNTLVLPALTAVPGGFFFVVKNANALNTVVTLQPAAGDTIEGGSSFAVARNANVIVVADPFFGWRTLGNIVLQNNSVTNAVLSDMAANTLKGNNTGATGDPIDLTVAQVKTLLNLQGTNNGDQTITLTGDVTGSGTGTFAATIANNAVSNAKAADMAANSIKGNNTGATGDPLDLSAAQVAAMLPLNTNGAGARTISTALPSGGADGDIWYQV
jgi:hypothetical protein